MMGGHMDLAELFSSHAQRLQAETEKALAATGHDSLVLSSGAPFTYFADDQDAPFKSTPHFAHWCPLEGPQHLLSIRPGAKPVLVAVKPEDYWYEQAPLGKPFWLDAFEVHEVADVQAAWKIVSTKGRTAYLGDDAPGAQTHGIAPGSVQPTALCARLDWDRAYKTAYEVECLAAAEKLAQAGIQVVQDRCLMVEHRRYAILG